MPAPTRLLVCLLVSLYALLALQHRGGLRWDSDEGINWAKGRLVADAWSGQGTSRLYHDIWSDQPPFYTLATALPIAAGGIRGARAVTVAISLLGLLGSALAATALAKGLGLRSRAVQAAGPAAILLLAIAPNFWWASRAAMIGLPAFSLASAAMGWLLLHAAEGRRSQLILAGGFFGLSLVTKLQMAYLGPLAVLSLLSARHLGLRLRLGQATLFTLLAFTPLSVAALFFGPARFWQQVFGTYLSTRSSYPVDLAANGATLWTWLSNDHRGLALLCAAGLIALVTTPSPSLIPTEGEALSPRRQHRVGLIYGLWLLLTIITPLQHAPLWIKDHFLPLLLAMVPGAALASGIALDAAAERWSRRGAGTGARPGVHSWMALTTILAALLYLGGLPRLLRLDLALARARSYDNDGLLAGPNDDEGRSLQRKEDAIRAAGLWLRATTEEGAFVATDHQLVAAWADRRVLPAFAAYSSRAAEIGAFDDAFVQAALDRDPPAAVLLWDGDIAGSVGLQRWLASACGPAVADFGMDRLGYRCGPRSSPAAPAADAGGPTARFATADLLGFAVEPAVLMPSAGGLDGEGDEPSLEAGQTLVELRLFWLARRASHLPLSVSVHVLDGSGTKVAQHDGTPAEGGRPSDEWRPGEVIVDRHLLAIPREPGGPLLARVGLYEPLGGQREGLELPAESAAGPSDAIDLALPGAAAAFRFDPMEEYP